VSIENYRLAIVRAQTGVDQGYPSFRAGTSPNLDKDLISVLHAVSLLWELPIMSTSVDCILMLL
jgi:hypothetical protein